MGLNRNGDHRLHSSNLAANVNRRVASQPSRSVLAILRMAPQKRIVHAQHVRMLIDAVFEIPSAHLARALQLDAKFLF
jgi:hypothetical protein